ncbi:hypothetical protein EW026_g2324 [Hermanssonia centrifuga]|uniref:Uncharacterized protein n=2 Tax=Hermanssonia centrifuga TaxID=98765 RepID=A0A4S4KPM1_9APHY|nr:hypothetical protein PHLCEN_2v10262 [Hermanssonia centrifuga]THH00157.1 hypothetical protein EW026_g2324 [Hermanssonia centrifuga]
MIGLGLLVSILIVQQGWAITVAAFRQLTDASVTPQTRITLLDALEPLLPSNHGSTTPSQIEQHTENLLSIKDLRAMRAGALMFVDLTAEVPRMLSVEDASTLEGKIARTLKQARKEIAEVRVKFHPTESDEVL